MQMRCIPFSYFINRNQNNPSLSSASGAVYYSEDLTHINNVYAGIMLYIAEDIRRLMSVRCRGAETFWTGKGGRASPSSRKNPFEEERMRREGRSWEEMIELSVTAGVGPYDFDSLMGSHPWTVCITPLLSWSVSSCGGVWDLWKIYFLLELSSV